MSDGYSALQLARGVGMGVHHVSEGGARVRPVGKGGRLLVVGPDATELEILRLLVPHLQLPKKARQRRIKARRTS